MTEILENMTSFWPTWLKWCPSSDYSSILAEMKLLNLVQCTKELFSVDIFEHKFKIRTLHAYRNKFDNDAEKQRYKSRNPIVLVHGMGAGLAMWCKNIDDLSNYREIYAFDLLGFGNSSRPKFPNNPREVEDFFVESINEWRKVLKLRQFILMGHSLGGFLVSAYTLKYPNIISHLILVDPWGMRECKHKRKNKIQLHWKTLLLVIGTIMKYMNPLFPMRLLGPFAPPILRMVRQDLGRTFQPNYLDLTKENYPEMATIRHLVHADSSVTHETINPNVREPNTDYNSSFDAIFDYIYHCNVKLPTGECAFRALSEPVGWAARPIINRINQLDSNNVPITFVYGGKSWMDWHTGYQFQNLLSSSSSSSVTCNSPSSEAVMNLANPTLDSRVIVRVFDNAGHHVYAEASAQFNWFINHVCLLIEREIDTVPDSNSSLNSPYDSCNDESSDDFAL